MNGRLLLASLALCGCIAASAWAQSEASNVPAPEVRPAVSFSFSSPTAPKSETKPADAAAPVGNSPPPADSGAADPGKLWLAQFDLLPEAVRLKWSPIPGAIRYFIEVFSDSILLNRLWIGTTEGTEALAPLHGFIPKGPVFARLQAVNAESREISSFVTSSLIGRANDLPGGISGISITTRQTERPVVLPPAPRRDFQWGPAQFSRDLTLISGKFGSESYSNYLVSHGLDWYGDSPSLSVSSGARLLVTANDREGLSLNRSDLNLSTHLFVASKEVPAHFSYSGYLYRPFGGEEIRSVNSFGVGYRVLPGLTTGAQFTPNPRYLSAWGAWTMQNGSSLLLQYSNSDFSNAVTLTYQSRETLR